MKSRFKALMGIIIPGSVALFLVMQVACGSGSNNGSAYTPTEAKPGTPVITAAGITTSAFGYTNAVVTSATLVAAGTSENAGGSNGQVITMPEYVKVLGTLNQRTSSVDSKSYAISFEMRLPTNWNGRFFHQVNGGTDGTVVAAYGDVLGAGQAECALSKGFAVISSNAGHATETGTIGGGLYGIDPQARLDYGYNAVGQLTPMAKALIKLYYGRNPDKSYIGGTSNGGRHTMVAASRFGDQYDGYLVGSPGFNLPKAAVAQLWGVQQYATIATSTLASGRPDITTAFTAADLKLVADTIIAKADALDGAADGVVSDFEAAQAAFNIDTDIPTCSPDATTHDGLCLSTAQKTVLKAVHAGAKNSSNTALYTNFLWDRGISSSGWRTWKYTNSTTNRDPLSVAFVFMTPPVSPTLLDGTGTTLLDFAMNYSSATTPKFNIDTDASTIYDVNSTYTESAMSFMTPPDLMMSKMVNNHGRMIVVHGSADPVFSAQDTINWFKNFRTNYGDSSTAGMLRLFIVPGMGHSRGGPAMDKYGTATVGSPQNDDLLDKLVAWVEKGTAPDSVITTARGTGGTISPANSEVPAGWNVNRSRPLYPYPKIAKYIGTDGDYDKASNFGYVAP